LREHQSFTGAPFLERAGVKEVFSVIGLGYVGLPLAVSIAENFGSVIGFDISRDRISALLGGYDETGEIKRDRLEAANIRLSGDPADLSAATFHIVAVPTPIDAMKKPDLGPLIAACRLVGKAIRPGCVVVFESTVYPGATEKVCRPILEEMSGLVAGVGFNIGYSPERINPGDKVNRLETIVKLVSGDTEESLERIATAYEALVRVGVHRCASIAVAEAAKVLENTQRDVNIALMNEMSLICSRIGIAVNDVIDAASTKWNFAPFRPGLVGGHCIGVDPYYMTAVAEQYGWPADLIHRARKINDAMPRHVADAFLRLLSLHAQTGRRPRIGLFGITFKEDVPDLRNSKAIDLIRELADCGFEVLIHDPVCTSEQAAREGVTLTPGDGPSDLDMLILAVPHQAYLSDPAFLDRLRPGGVLGDIKGAYRKGLGGRDLVYWSL
jgi:UDP-N-acetyl-D-glucosamine/UDP-N-acetyl-D-galactosamine dehydrogenase